MLFKKNDTQVNIDGTAGASAAVRVLQLRKKMHAQLAVVACCIAVLSISSYAFITRAWYANNREVEQSNTIINSGTVTPSLYIRPQGDTSQSGIIRLESAASSDCELFPISTSDLTNWYYVDQFTFEPSTATINGTTYTISKQIASRYTKAAISLSTTMDANTTGTYIYYNGYELATKVAFFKASNNLYVIGGDTDTLDVYLDPTDPISVTTTESEATDGFYQSVRVGIQTPGGFIIYAPVDEENDKVGNSTGAAVGKFYAITGATTLTDADGIVKLDGVGGIAPYQASAGANEGFFDAGSIKLGTADTDTGLDINVYVWLEGTDAQAIVNSSDGNADGVGSLSVSLKYVGVDPS